MVRRHDWSAPTQYGFVSTKHLCRICRIELHAAEPSENYHPSAIVDVGMRLLQPHPRARVWEEERHRYLPARSVRRFYRLLIAPIAFLGARGSRHGRTPPASAEECNGRDRKSTRLNSSH